jgi:O-antigen/teichoic acid export membrane protein
MEEWQRRFWHTAASAYIGVVIRILLGLVLFRTMFQEFSHEQFGFWALLWSLFGYGILLDFGFGFTAQKAVAEKTATGDMVGLSRLLATILWTFIGMACILLVVFLTIREPFMARMGVAVADRAEFGRAYTVFFVGLALMFPLGVFPEILRGLQRTDIANWVWTATTVFNFVMLYWGLTAHWDMAILMGVSILTTIIPNLVAAVLALKFLPKVSYSPRLFEWRSVKAQMGFSITAYLVTFSNMILAKSDQLVISLSLGVAFVAIYQAGFKMGEMLGIFSVQLQQVLSPAAASLHARGNESGLRSLLLRSSRLTFLLVTPCYILSAVYLSPLILLLTGKEVTTDTWWIGHVLLLAIYSSQLTNSCSKRVLMMCGEEKPLLYISVVEAIANLILSIILARTMGVLGVAIGTMIPTILIGWFWVVPLTIRRFQLPLIGFVAYHLRETSKPLLVFSGILGALIYWAPANFDSGFIALGWRAALCGLPLVYLSRKVIRSMSQTEDETALTPR